MSWRLELDWVGGAFFKREGEGLTIFFNSFLQKAIESLQVLYKRTSSIEAEQVAEDIDEAVDLEGRPQINHLEKEQSKKRKWRRTGTIKLSQDYRDVF